MKRIIVLAVSVLMVVMLLSGCFLFDRGEDTTPSPSESVQPSATASASASVTLKPMESSPAPSINPSSTPAPSSDPVTYEDNKIEFEYYDVAQDKTVDATVEIEGEGDVQSAINAVNDVYIKKVLGDSGIQTNSIVYKEGNIYIDFTDSIYNLNLGSAGESSVLESIADAYLNNIDGIKAVYFSVNGYDYSSGHIEFSKDEPYKTK